MPFISLDCVLICSVLSCNSQGLLRPQDQFVFDLKIYKKFKLDLFPDMATMILIYDIMPRFFSKKRDLSQCNWQPLSENCIAISASVRLEFVQKDIQIN